MSDLADVIFNNKELDLYTKIIRLWALGQLSGYRSNFAAKCSRLIADLTNPAVSMVIGFVTGFSQGNIKRDVLKGLIPELNKTRTNIKWPV